MSPVGLDVFTEGRDFVRLALAVEYGDRAMLDAYRHRPPEQLPHLVRVRRRGEVEVVMREPQEGVPHRAPHAPGLEAGVLQLLGDPQHIVGDRDPGWESHEAIADCEL